MDALRPERGEIGAVSELPVGGEQHAPHHCGVGQDVPVEVLAALVPAVLRRGRRSPSQQFPSGRDRCSRGSLGTRGTPLTGVRYVRTWMWSGITLGHV